MRRRSLGRGVRVSRCGAGRGGEEVYHRCNRLLRDQCILLRCRQRRNRRKSRRYLFLGDQVLGTRGIDVLRRKE